MFVTTQLCALKQKMKFALFYMTGVFALVYFGLLYSLETKRCKIAVLLFRIIYFFPRHKSLRSCNR